jgi:hypothetical protein
MIRPYATPAVAIVSLRVVVLAVTVVLEKEPPSDWIAVCSALARVVSV